MKAWMSSNSGKFATELRPLIDVRIWFLLNILKTNRPIKTKFCIHIIIDKIFVGIVNHCFFYVLCFTWPRYQVSVYRTIGPLVLLTLILIKFSLSVTLCCLYSPLKDNLSVYYIYTLNFKQIVVTVEKGLQNITKTCPCNIQQFFHGSKKKGIFR